MANSSYDSYVLSLDARSYLMLDESSGALAADATGNSRNGSFDANVTVGGATFLDGRPCPLINDGFINWNTTALRSAFNGAEHAVMGWAKANHWTDNSDRYLLSLLSVDNNFTRIYGRTTDYWLFATHRAGGTVESLLLNGMDEDAWFHWAITVSKSNERARLYINAEMIAESITLGVWSDELATSNGAVLGAVNTVGGSAWGANPMARVSLHGRELSSAEILAAYKRIASVRHIMFVGDSKSDSVNELWRRLVQMRLREDRLAYHAGPEGYAVSGGTVATIKANVDANLGAETVMPTTLLCNLGANEMTTMPDEATWKANYTAIIDAFRAKWPSATIYIAIPWRQGKEAEVATLAGWIGDIIAGYPSGVLHGVDERTVLPGEDDGATMTTDGTHYSDAGHVAIATAWINVLTT